HSAAFHDCFDCGDLVFAAVPSHFFDRCFWPINLGQSSRIDGATERAVGRNWMSSYHGKGRAGFKDPRRDQLAFAIEFLESLSMNKRHAGIGYIDDTEVKVIR